MPNCSNCGQPLEGSNSCRFCGAFQVSPDTTQPQQPISPYSQGPGYQAPGYQQYQYPGQAPYQGPYPAQGAYPAQPYPAQPSPPPPGGRSMLPVIVGLIALVLVVAGGITAFALLSGDDKDNSEPVAAGSTSQGASEGTPDSPDPTSATRTQTATPKPTPKPTRTQPPKPQVTVTVTKPPKPPKPTVTVTKEVQPDPVETEDQSSAIDCGNDIWADGTASCAFAGNVAQAYWDSGGAATLYDVYSPVTGLYYDLDCWGSDPVTCQTGRAIIFFY
jgi:hypothetical protein